MIMHRYMCTISHKKKSIYFARNFVKDQRILMPFLQSDLEMNSTCGVKFKPPHELSMCKFNNEI